MHTPSAKYFCPRCRSAFDNDNPFCGQCGADMRHASRLNMGAMNEAGAPRRQTGQRPARRPSMERRGSDPWLGKLVDNRYRVEEVIGRGGMGVVYKIKHQRMGKIAAMKVLHSELAKDRDVVARFQLEAEAVSRLAHPNTVQVFDFGTAEGALYLVMEYVRGQDLGAIIDRDGPMSFEELAPLLGQICGSLEEAHDLGIVHRDLKPENLLVSRTHSGHDFVKVLDFGLAKLSEREESASVTSAGSIVGTPYYMSPEQIRAEDEIDKRADIYSVGALMYRLLTADNAFNAKSPVGVLTKHLTEELEPPSHRYPALGLPKAVDDIIVKAMAKDRNDRYQNIRELLEDVEHAYVSAYADSSDIRQPPTSWLASAHGGTVPMVAMLDEVDHGIDSGLRLKREDLDDFETSLRRRRWLRVLGIPLVLAAVAGAGAYYFFLRPARPSATEIEDNNELSQATLIAPNTEVTGFIGKRLSSTVSDRDYFKFNYAPPRDGSEVVDIEVSAIPNVDLSLYLYDSQGGLLTQVNRAGVGQPEFLRRWRVQREVVVAVAGELSELGGGLPIENVSDAYVLSVRFAPVDARLESEPNDGRADANELAVGSPVTGHLDDASDIDCYRFTSPGGSHQLLISGGPDLPFQWQLGDAGGWKSDFKATLDLATGNVLCVRVGKEAKGTALPNAPYTIDISKK